jgi:hypothetical protein
MLISVRSNLKKNIKDKMISLSSYILEKMLSEEDRENLIVQIRFDSKLDADGYCGMTYDEDSYMKKQTDMTISLNRNHITTDHIYRVLSHEMIHVAQYASGRLRERPTCTIWEGKKISKKLCYRSRPEEVEAWNLEGKLLGSWKRTKDGRKMKHLQVKMNR